MDGPRFRRGFAWGVVATVAMSALMVAGILTGVAPMPSPIPAAIVGRLTGGGLPQAATMALAVVLHLGYGGFWGGVLAAVVRRVTLWRGIALGVFLWLIMQLVVLPFLGWGLFGTAQTPKIAVATLVLHLVYGATYGWLMDRPGSDVAARHGAPGAGAGFMGLALLLVLPPSAVAQQAAPECWVRGDRANLELRASPYDSTSLALDGGTVKVCYSRPRKLGRPIIGRLVPYGEPWRFGANEATAIHMPTSGTIAGVPVGPGWYSLIALPGEREWRIVVNRSVQRWGIPIDEELREADVGSGTVPASVEVGVVELLTMELVPRGASAADLAVAWDRTRLRIPVALRKR